VLRDADEDKFKHLQMELGWRQIFVLSEWQIVANTDFILTRFKFGLISI